MRFKFLFVTFLMATLITAGGFKFVQASEPHGDKPRGGNLKVNGYVDISLIIMEEEADDHCFDSSGDLANCEERKFRTEGEVDFESTHGPLTFRLDLDMPGATIEQAKFVWALPVAKEMGLSLTAGSFNAPIGFELQDHPDRLQVTTGQLFDLVPANLAGVMVSGGMDMVSLDLYFVNEWRGIHVGGESVGEENSFGALLTVIPIEDVSLAVGYITSPEVKPGAVALGTSGTSDQDVLDVVLTGKMRAMPEIEVFGAVEFLTDENNTAYGLVVRAEHHSANYPHGLTVRYNSVDCDLGSSYGKCKGLKVTPTSLTVAAFVELAENLEALLEWRSDDPDSAEDSTDLIELEFVVTF